MLYHTSCRYQICHVMLSCRAFHQARTTIVIHSPSCDPPVPNLGLLPPCLCSHRFGTPAAHWTVVKRCSVLRNLYTDLLARPYPILCKHVRGLHVCACVFYVSCCCFVRLSPSLPIHPTPYTLMHPQALHAAVDIMRARRVYCYVPCICGWLHASFIFKSWPSGLHQVACHCPKSTLSVTTCIA